MNFLQTKINEMKKRKEEGNKGFSLVELIIVIAIMAILVGIVGTQVIPYINKSKESKDQQIVNSFSTAAVTAYSENAEDAATSGTIKIFVYGTGTNAGTGADKIADTIKEKTYKDKAGSGSSSTTESGISQVKDKLKSKNASQVGDIYVEINVDKHTVVTRAVAAGNTTAVDGIKEVKADL